jgi:hypothetical protein
MNVPFRTIRLMLSSPANALRSSRVGLLELARVLALPPQIVCEQILDVDLDAPGARDGDAVLDAEPRQLRAEIGRDLASRYWLGRKSARRPAWERVDALERPGLDCPPDTLGRTLHGCSGSDSPNRVPHDRDAANRSGRMVHD